MQRIPPSQKIRQRINGLLNDGLQGEEDITTYLFRLGAERLIQEMLEQGVTDYVILLEESYAIGAELV